MKLSRIQVVMLALTCFLSIGLPNASACSVPVFRYALELWAPDPFPVTLFHQGELTEAEQELVEQLNAAADQKEINLRVELADINGDIEPEPLAVWESLEIGELERPLLVLQTPTRRGPSALVLTLDLTIENVEQLLDSPAREEIRKRILKGDSVVWVLLESGQAEKDDKAFATLSSQLLRLQETLELPELAAEDVGSLSPDADPLKLAFSALRVQRDDPAERALVEMLLTVEPDLQDPEFAEQPIVFPIFGRGRALYALVGDGITPFTIEEAARYLTGACQCTVKAENPGADLVFAVDWDRYITPILLEKTELPPLGGLASFAGLSDENSSNLTDLPAAKTAQATTDTPAAEPEAEAEVSPEQDRLESIGAARGISATTTNDRSRPGVSASNSTTISENPSRLGVNALIVVSLLGAVVLVAGVVLTRKES